MKQSLINASHGMVYFGPQWSSVKWTSVKCTEAVWNYKEGGVVHLKSPAFFGFFFSSSSSSSSSFLFFSLMQRVAFTAAKFGTFKVRYGLQNL